MLLSWPERLENLPISFRHLAQICDLCHQVLQSEEFLQAAIDAGEVVWNRGLLKRVCVCHGISGNAYVFLSLYRLTGKPEFLYKAKAFACFLHDQARTLISEGIMHGGDRPYSLFEGLGEWLICFWT